MLDNSTLPANPSSPTSDRRNEEVAGDGGSVSVGLEEEDRAGLEQGYRNWAGNRWPRQETLALLKIRSDMDAEFKVASAKMPLWEEVSRKMGEHGYNRNAKKCKEKFENIYKYHKRTREGRDGRSAGKTYKYFEQLEAIEHHHFERTPLAEAIQTSTAETAATSPKDGVYSAIPSSLVQHQLSSFVDNFTPPTTSCSSKESEGTDKKKRRVSEFFEKLMKQVIDKQENLQTKFVEVLDKYEQDRIAREEAWKMQELARIERERELLAQERSVAAAKDTAVLAFLQKFSEQAASVQLSGQACSVRFPNQPSSVQLPVQACSVQLPNQPSSVQLPVQACAVRIQMPDNSSTTNLVTDKQKKDGDWNLVRRSLEKPEKNNGRSHTPISSTRWPREEVEALIRLRSNYDLQYQENGSKGHLWEEISASIKKLGYDRNAKRCKEKWENINKYYRRLKDSNKKRPEDSKTCAYVKMLDALYCKKTSKAENQVDSNYELRPEELLMHMMAGQEEQHQPEAVTENGDSENVEKIQGDNGSGEGEGDVVGDGYRIVAANPSSTEQDNPSMASMS